MINHSKFQQALNELSDYLETEEYIGYDPYDILLSYIPFRYAGKWIPVLATQMHKRNPVNIRPLIGIKKDFNPKAIGLLLQAYSLLYGNNKRKEERNNVEDTFREQEKFKEEVKRKEEVKIKMNFFYKWLLDNYTKGFSGSCWGYNFPWAGSVKYIEANYPSAIVTGFIGKALFEYYIQTGNQEVLSTMKSAGEFIMSDLQVTEDKTGICFSYTPLLPDCCYNASLLAAELLAKLYYLTRDDSLLIKVEKAVSFILCRQKPDGRWNYSLNIENGREREQIDFHQGYILESLYEIRNFALKDYPEINNSLIKGLEFYRKQQFLQDGRSRWRLPAYWPVDIHSQAQGIITFCKLKEFNPDYLSFAQAIGKWTIENMQDRTGYFYYQIHKFYKNKISYIRWAQSWMFLALTHLNKTIF